MQENCVSTPETPTLTTKTNQIYNLANSLEQACVYVNRKLLGDTTEAARSEQKEPACLTDVLDSIYSTLNNAITFIDRVASEFD